MEWIDTHTHIPMCPLSHSLTHTHINHTHIHTHTHREEVTQLLDVLKSVQKAYEDKLKTHTKASTAADRGLSEVCVYVYVRM